MIIAQRVCCRSFHRNPCISVPVQNQFSALPQKREPRGVTKLAFRQYFNNDLPRISKYLTLEEALLIDQDLFNEYKFSAEQLIELCGLSCAHAICKVYLLRKYPRVFVFCGPDNNGGIGIACARHLSMMSYKPTIYYAKQTDEQIFKNMVCQCRKSKIKFNNACPKLDEIEECFDLTIDALFGICFKPPMPEEFADIIKIYNGTTKPIASIDIPSGWDVEKGKEGECQWEPEMLISLIAPKKCAKRFLGKYHYLGGRFVPGPLESKYQLELPEYPGHETCAKLQ